MPRKILERRIRGQISRIAAFAHVSIWVVCAAIALTFSVLTLKDIPFGAAIANTNPQYLRAIILSGYISCWAFGTSADTSVQNSVYLIDPQGGRVRFGAVIAIAGLATISIVLLLVRFDDLKFSLALAAFTAIDILAWLYLRYSFLPPIIEATAAKYRADSDYYGQILLNAVVAQISGNWKWARQVFLSMIVIVMVAAAAFPNVKELVANLLASVVPFATVDALRPITEDILLLAFLLVSEVWHFTLRFRTLITITVLGNLEDKFTIRPRSMR